jgi:hypothetical protein
VHLAQAVENPDRIAVGNIARMRIVGVDLQVRDARPELAQRG